MGSDMAGMIGFMATWTTYGTWLQGHKKGYVKNGTILDANSILEQSNQASLQHEKVKSPQYLREIVKNTILEEAKQIGQEFMR